MKKALSILTTLAALAGSASAAGYVLPTNTPGALTPADWQPTYNIEGLYAIGEDEMMDTWGVRGSFSLYDSGMDTVRHQFSLNLGAEFGSDSETYDGLKEKANLWMVPITAGYDVNIGVTDNVFIDLGVKAGWTIGEIEVKWNKQKDSADFDGFTLGVGAGIKILCSDRLYFKVGYEFNRTFVSDDVGININQHLITVGLGTQF